MAEEYPLHTIDRTAEYEDFIAKLRVYHEKRGTAFDPEPKISNTSVDLLKIFKLVMEHGGYDKVCDEKLLWRRLRILLGIPASNIPSTAYSLKEKYYKYLAAFEISTVHGKEPPPKDILEDTTAKGGGLLTRTRENYQGAKHLGEDSAASGDDATPSRERPSTDTTPVGTSVRATRGLREAPPQRVIFQPDTGSSRNRPGAGTQQSHLNQVNRLGGHMNTSSPYQHGMPSSGQLQSGASPLGQPRARGPSSSFNPPNMENVATAVENYLPRSLQAPVALPVRPVDTPMYNPAEFARRRQIARQQAMPAPLPVGTPGGKSWTRSCA